MIALGMQNSELYNLCHLFALRGAVDVYALKNAWAALVQHHAVFRTTFALVEGNGASNFVQVVRKSLDIVWQEEVSSENEIQRTIEGVLFNNLGKGYTPGAPLMRLALIKVADDHYKCAWFCHHAITDAWGDEKLFLDLRHAYLNWPVMQRAPFKLYMRYMLSLDTAAAEQFWKTYLHDASPTPFPAEQTAVQYSMPHESRMLHITGDFTSMLKSHGITAATLLRAAWALTMGLAADSDDVLFGCIHSGRDVPVSGVSEMLGMCLQTVPVRVRIDRRETLLDYLRRVQDEYAEVARHGHLGLRRIRQQVDNFPSGHLFQAFINFRGFSEHMADAERLLPFDMTVEDGLQREDTPLSITVDYENESLHVYANYDPQRIEDDDMAVVLARLQQLATELLGVRSMAVGDLDMLTADERATLQRGICAPVDDLTAVAPTHRFLHEMFEARAHDSADSVAIDFEGRELVTYGELNARANRIAALLRDEHGVQPDAIVPLCLDKSPDMVAAMLGVLKAGGAYAPLDPTHPVDRLAHIVSETEARVVLTTTAYAHLFSVAAVCLDQDAVNTDLATRSSDNRAVDRLHERNLAYVIYTSGSTGKPKGVLAEHGATVASVTCQRALFRLAPNTRVLQYSNYTFDMSVADIYVTFASGAVVCMAVRAALMDNLSGLVRRMHIEHVFLTVSILDMIDPADACDLHTVIVGAEKGTCVWCICSDCRV